MQTRQEQEYSEENVSPEAHITKKKPKVRKPKAKEQRNGPTSEKPHQFDNSNHWRYAQVTRRDRLLHHGRPRSPLHRDPLVRLNAHQPTLTSPPHS